MLTPIFFRILFGVPPESPEDAQIGISNQVIATTSVASYTTAHSATNYITNTQHQGPVKNPGQMRTRLNPIKTFRYHLCPTKSYEPQLQIQYLCHQNQSSKPTYFHQYIKIHIPTFKSHAPPALNLQTLTTNQSITLVNSQSKIQSSINNIKVVSDLNDSQTRGTQTINI